MNGLVLSVELSAEQLEQIALRVACLLADPQPSSPTWLDTTRAAEYMAATTGRIHDLVQLGKLHPRRDGRRLLFRRDDLDAYLEASA
jgi:excisionase family DNA binding protein